MINAPISNFFKTVTLSLAVLLISGCGVSGLFKSESEGGEKSETKGQKDDLKPYSKVITSDVKTDDGLFTVHRKDDKLYYEIPDSLLGREMILVSRLAKTAEGFGYGGVKAQTNTIRWERVENRILLRSVSHEKVAEEDTPIYEAVRNSTFEPIVRSFDVEALSSDSANVVIEVSDFYKSDVKMIGIPEGARKNYEVRTLDGDRTYINYAKSFPENIEVRHVLTYEAADPPSGGSANSLSVEMNQSMVLLPKEPMTARSYDKRVGYFSVEQTNFSSDRHEAHEEKYITRWRLEPSDSAAYANGEIVEPVEQIAYYVDPATPEKWRPYIKKGIEDWQEAFRAAGYKNAIIAKDPPSEEGDPEFSPEDVRYSVIRWFPSEVENAYGPHVHDPRSGEILESDIGMYHNIFSLLRDWYFVQTAAANPEARAVQFDDDVMGKLLRFVVAHEVGHTLGLPHNWGSSWATPVDSLRSPSYTSEHGTAPSIMDYARFNYIAQPGDGVESFTPDIGAYDIWSIEWGYSTLVDAESADAREKILNDWVREHADDSTYFYGSQTMNPIDPRSQREDLGHDAMKASEYGMKNLERVVNNLLDWTYREGESYGELDELYDAVFYQYDLYAGHVVRQIGGVYKTNKNYEQEGEVYKPVSSGIQSRAMEFLNSEVFDTPEWLLNKEVLRRLEHAGGVEQLRSIQVDALELLLDPERIARLIEADATGFYDDVYQPESMLADLREGMWSEVYEYQEIGPYRRNLQRAYIEKMQELMHDEVSSPPSRWREYIGFTDVDVSQSDIRPLARGELNELSDDITGAVDRIDNRKTRLHLEDIQARIDKILDKED